MRPDAPSVGPRALVFAGISTTLAAGAHVLGGGPPPGVAALLGGLLLVLLTARTAARRERGTLGLVLGLGATQLGFHVAFLGEHHHGAAHPAAGGAMTLAHVAAVGAVAGWLRIGEARVWAAARRVRDAVRWPPAPLALAAVPPARRPPASAGRHDAAPSLLLTVTVRRRGPPRAPRPVL